MLSLKTGYVGGFEASGIKAQRLKLEAADTAVINMYT